jgi:hypothetical protein
MRKNLAVLFLALVFMAAGAILAGTAKAALIDNGNNLIYDTALNITWYDPAPTFMTWNTANTWAAGLTVGGTTAGTWTLPTTLPVNGSTYNYNWSYNGSTDYGYNISAPGSAYPGSTANQMAYLFYVELGNKGYYNVNGNVQSGWGLVNKGPLTNLQSFLYWSGTEYAPSSSDAWCFGFVDGGQYVDPKGFNVVVALAVHSGDVGAPVPIPGAILLFAPGLAGIAALKRRIGRRG